MAAMSLKSPDTLAVAYSNYFETVSTVTNQLVNQTHFQVVIFAFNRLLLYSIIHGIIMCSTWFLDIRISACLLLIRFTTSIDQ